MSNWRIVTASLLFTQVGCARTMEITLLDGRATKRTIVGTRIAFDGDKNVKIASGSRTSTLEAKTPAVLQISQNGRYLAHNYGNGSGQVYNLSIYYVSPLREIDISELRKEILKFAQDRGCNAKPDEVSILFETWTENTAKIKTEDFTRREGCSILNKRWFLQFDGIKVTGIARIR